MRPIFDPAEMVIEPTEHRLVHTNQRTGTITSYCDAVGRVILAMYKRFDEPLPLQDMAAIATLIPCHFNHVLRRITGITPGHFLGAIRLKAAPKLLPIGCAGKGT